MSLVEQLEEDLAVRAERLEVDRSRLDPRLPVEVQHSRSSRHRGGRSRWLVAAAFVGLMAIGVWLASPGGAPRETVDATEMPMSTTTASAEPAVVMIFMSPTATTAEIDELDAVLLSDPDVDRVEYISQAEAHAGFAELLAPDDPLVDEVAPEVLPSSFEVTLRPGADPNAFHRRVEHRDGVYSVEVGGTPSWHFELVLAPGFTPLGDITERPAGAPNNAVLIDGPLRDLLALGPLRLVAVDGPIDGSSAASACVEGLPGADRDVALNHAERIESAEGIETVRLGAGPCPQVSPR